MSRYRNKKNPNISTICTTDLNSINKTEQDTINKSTINTHVNSFSRSQNCIHNLLLQIITTKQGEELFRYVKINFGITIKINSNIHNRNVT